MNAPAKILAALRASGLGVSGTELCQQLGVSRAAVWAHIESLRAAGFEIVASPHRGYQLVKSPDALLADDLTSRLGNVSVIGRKIIVLSETTSTNDEIEKAAHANRDEGLVVFAESQTQGRGRRGRSWSSPARKGLWFSILLRPQLAPDECTQLTVATATALVRAIRSVTGVTVEIKWPNDLLVRGKKLAGILTELSAELDHVRYVIIGIGIDCNQTASDFPRELRAIATSLKLTVGKPISRTDLAVTVLRELDFDYARIRDGDFNSIAEEWAAHCGTLGRQVDIEVGQRRITGRAEALDESGALLLRSKHGQVERVISGDVTLAK